MNFEAASLSDASELAELRARAMKPSLLEVARFDEDRVRSRFLSAFVPADTKKIVVDGRLCGFFVLKENSDHLYLDHLYVDPDCQSQGIGHAVIKHIVQHAERLESPIRLGALRESRANSFYQSLGFVQTHEDAYDIYYEFNPGK